MMRLRSTTPSPLRRILVFGGDLLQLFVGLQVVAQLDPALGGADVGEVGLGDGHDLLHWQLRRSWSVTTFARSATIRSHATLVPRSATTARAALLT